ncbi:MAG: hypothetical protein WD355_03920 [Balneolaceae bacterium]
MDETGACLGLQISGHQLYYAVHEGGVGNHLQHIGCIDFSFSLKDALFGKRDGIYTGLQNTLCNLGKKYSCTLARIVTPADQECWSTLPRLVYETPDEREDHLSILMGEIPRDQLESTWFPLSSQDFRLLLIRKREHLNRLRELLKHFPQCDFISEFEIGSEWHRLTGVRGSYITIHCHQKHLAVSSFLLGKLRGATTIPFDHIHDLPYLWSYHGNHLSWLHGIHEQAYIFGKQADEVRDALVSFISETGNPVVMNNLYTMRVVADEETYGFPLESAFPAILLSLNRDNN